MIWNRSLYSLVVAFTLTACPAADLTQTDKPDGGELPPPQCPEGQLECTGDPDQNTLICRCRAFFDCPTPEKCGRDAPVPPGGGAWDCTWQEFKYTCTSKDGKIPPGESGWSCVKTEQGVTCTTTPVAPDGSGSWACKVVGSALECEKKPDGIGVWKCTPDKKQCTQGTDSLPSGGGSWKCHQTLKDGNPTWVCVGDSTTPPGGGGWTCVKLELDQWRCEMPAQDLPPGGGSYQCVKGSEVGGTKCDLVPKKTDENACQIGETMWCDGLLYCGWGQVSCNPKTGKWKTRLQNGKVVLDCEERADGARPNTVCACYHFYFNPTCCERPDCVIPSGTKPRICPVSAGGLCDYCNPQKSECKGVGAKCIVSNAHETFCGELCGAQKPCPVGFQCLVVKLAGGQTTNQCAPADLSCYF